MQYSENYYGIIWLYYSFLLFSLGAWNVALFKWSTYVYYDSGNNVVLLNYSYYFGNWLLLPIIETLFLFYPKTDLQVLCSIYVFDGIKA